MSVQTFNDKDYAEVYFWLPKNQNGAFGSPDIQKTDSNSTLVRVGHVGLRIFLGGRGIEYISLRPAVFTKVEGGTTQASILHTFEEDQRKEKSLPTCIIRLHKLDTFKMLEIWAAIKHKITELNVRWAFDASPTKHIDHPKCKTANSATVVYTLLRRGGFCKQAPYLKINQNGPSRTNLPKDFYSVTRCDLEKSGSSKGIWKFSPQALLLIAASGASVVGEDLRETTKIMNGDRVEQLSK